MNKIALWIVSMQMIGQSNERSSETKEKLVCMKGGRSGRWMSPTSLCV